MNKRSWTDDDRVEFELLVRESLAASRRVAIRRDVFLSGLDGAVQAHRYWAADVLQHIRHTGTDALLKREQELLRPRVPVAHDGMLLGKVPRVMGTQRRNDDGTLAHERSLFDYMTWDELRAKLPQFAQEIEANERMAHAVIRLLALEKRAPGTHTPAEACEQLGITVEEWLASESAA